ncbi:MAG: hypothetical protein V4684_11330 [Pseudomonadota bacterium]
MDRSVYSARTASRPGLTQFAHLGPLMKEHLLHVEQSLAFDRQVPTHDVALALS